MAAFVELTGKGNHESNEDRREITIEEIARRQKGWNETSMDRNIR